MQRPLSSRSSLASLALVLLGLSFAESAFALPFVTGGAGIGYTFVEGDKKSSSTGVAIAKGRFGYISDEYNFFFALDVNAYRFYKAGDLKADQDGNNLLLVTGYEYSGSSFWIAGGGGEIRTFNRPEEKTKPYRYLVTEYQLGYSLQLYASDYAKVELGVLLDRMQPDSDWQARNQARSLNSLQFDVGFKLFNW
jgi:hypothetical protein